MRKICRNQPRTFVFGVLYISLVAMGFEPSAFAGGLDNHNIGVKGMGMSYALVGITDDASAVYYNPSGLVFIDEGVWHGEVYGYIGDVHCEYTANGITDESTEPLYIPGLFVSRTREDWAVGLGFYVPYAGGGSSYNDFQGTPFTLETLAGWFCFTVSAAYQLSPNLAAGAGISLYAGMLEMEAFDPAIGDVIRSKYDGISGYGGHVGLIYKLRKALSVGLVVRSPVPVEMDGTAKVSGTELDSEARFTIPATFTVGLGYQPRPNLTIGIFGWYRLYSTLDALTFETAGVENEMKTFFHDSWVAGLGVEYLISTHFTLRAGMKYDQSPTEKEGMNPGFCDVDLMMFHFGLAYNVSDAIELNLGGAIAFGFEEEYNSQKFDKLNRILFVGLRF